MACNQELTEKEKCLKKIKEDFWDRVVIYTRESSKVLRQLAFAEGALFLFLYTHPCELTKVAIIGFLILILYFVVDCLQYILGFMFHRIAAKHWEKLVNERKISNPEDIQKDESITRSIYSCFAIKIILLIAASIVLFSIFIQALASSSYCLCKYEQNAEKTVKTQPHLKPDSTIEKND